MTISHDTPMGGVDPEMLAHYESASGAFDMRQEVCNVTLHMFDYADLAAAGDLLHAFGAGLNAIDVALRIAASPATSVKQLAYKAGFFKHHFPGFVESFDHAHVARIALATIAIEASRPTVGGVLGADLELGEIAGRKASTVPAERMRLYAETVEYWGDLRSLVETTMLVVQDRASLHSSRPCDAWFGATALMDDLIRRLCSMLGESAEESAFKIALLDDASRLYSAEGSALMVAMIGAARDEERRVWNPGARN